jgi:hypothetical protein
VGIGPLTGSGGRSTLDADTGTGANESDQREAHEQAERYLAYASISYTRAAGYCGSVCGAVMSILR